jgi:hypothetical protein
MRPVWVVKGLVFRSVKNTTFFPQPPGMASRRSGYGSPLTTPSALFARACRSERHYPAPQHLLNFFPLPHGHGSLRPILGSGRTYVSG